jgi:DNA-binding NarL/FixJ family response regulator
MLNCIHMTHTKAPEKLNHDVCGERASSSAHSGDDVPTTKSDLTNDVAVNTERTKVLIIDDHPVFRRGLIQVIADDPDFEILGEAGDGERALVLIQQLKPDVAVVDLGLPKLDGLGLIRRLRKDRCEVLLVILTMSQSESIFNEALDLGVNGYVLKDDAVNDILQSLRAVVDGKPYVSPAISGLLLRRAERSRELHQQNPTLSTLTPMERRILKLIAQNKTSKEIATELFISVHTVETHRCNICGKLELHGAQPVLRFALEHRSEL